MTQISAQSPVLTPAKQSKKRVPDKVLLGPKVRFGASDLPPVSGLERGSSTSSVDAGSDKAKPPAPDSQNAGGNFIEKVFEFFKKLQETLEALLDRLGKYLEELGEKLTAPKAEKREESPNTSGSGERSSEREAVDSHGRDKETAASGYVV